MILPSRHQPYWAQHASCADYPRLVGSVEADVVVIGAGITGLTTAALLKQAGLRVVVLEMSTIGAGTTGHSTGHLDAYPDRSLHELSRHFSEDIVRCVVQSRLEAIDLAEQLVNQHDINCDFQRIPAYLYAEDQQQIERLDKEQELAEKFGLQVERTRGVPVPFHVADALRFERFARFSPYAYVCGLADAVHDHAGPCRVLTDSRVIDAGQVNGRWRVATDGGEVHAEHLVAAVHAGYMSLFAIESRVYPWQSYVLAARVGWELPDALYWDMHEPYHYTRWASTADRRLLIIGGADHRTGELEQTDQAFNNLGEYLLQRYGSKVQIESHWSAEYFSSADGLPYIGAIPGKERAYIGTGYDGDGLTYGTVAGRVISDLVLGRESAWAEAYQPSRVKPAASAGKLVTGVSRMTAHWVGDRLKRGDISSVDEIPPDEGCVLRVNREKLAVYRDGEGQVHVCSAVCTHAGCIVHWNSSEKTWDCPCHGGRYDPYGKVIAAPPVKDLAPKSAAEVRI